MKRKRLTDLSLDFVSAVDRPAQEPATVAILKRKDEPVSDKPKTEDVVAYIKRLLDEGSIPEDAKDAEVKKAVLLTSETDGHTHLVWTGRYDGGEDKAGNTSWTDEHSHPWIRDEEGMVVIGAADGHTHEVAIVTKTQPPAEEAVPMPEKKNDDTAKSAEVIALEKQLAEARAISDLSDAHKAHFTTLKGDAQKAFLTKSVEDRDAAIAAVKLADDVVFKAADGTVYRKSDDPRLVQMAKQADADRTELAKERQVRRDAEYAKRAASEIAHLTGDEPTKVALLKSVAEITDDEQRGKVEEMLKSHDAGIAEILKTRGTSGKPETGAASPHAQLEGLAREHAKAQGVTFEKAYAAVLDTEAGKELYAKHAELNPTL